MTHKPENLWCPLARLSIQHWEGGCFREAVHGAYNQLVMVDAVRGQTGSQIIAATPCIRENCSLYRASFLKSSGGKCGLMRPDNGPWILAALVLVESLLIAATFVFSHWEIFRL